MNLKDIMIDYLNTNFDEIYRTYYPLVLEDCEDYNRPKTNFNFEVFLENWLNQGNLEDYSENSPFTKAICKEAVLNIIDNLAENITMQNGKIILARALETSPENLKKNIGECWSWNLNNAKVYDVPTSNHQLLITAAFHIDAICWGDTLGLNADINLGPAETEIRLKRGYPAQILKVIYNENEINLPTEDYTS